MENINKNIKYFNLSEIGFACYYNTLYTNKFILFSKYYYLWIWISESIVNQCMK
jgi:hypothetical protein